MFMDVVPVKKQHKNKYMHSQNHVSFETKYLAPDATELGQPAQVEGM